MQPAEYRRYAAHTYALLLLVRRAAVGASSPYLSLMSRSGRLDLHIVSAVQTAP